MSSNQIPKGLLWEAKLDHTGLDYYCFMYGYDESRHVILTASFLEGEVITSVDDITDDTDTLNRVKNCSTIFKFRMEE